MEEKKRLIIRIGASGDSFGAYSENCGGIYAAGDTVAEVMDDVVEAIRLIKETQPEDRWPEPIRGDYEIEWRYDTQSLLMRYQGIISNAALERLTGINRKQLWNYANGVSHPREKARSSIEKALHSLGQELMAVRLS